MEVAKERGGTVVELEVMFRGLRILRRGVLLMRRGVKSGNWKQKPLGNWIFVLPNG